MSNQPKVPYSSLSQFHANHVLRSEAAITDALQSGKYMRGSGVMGIWESLIHMEYPDIPEHELHKLAEHMLAQHDASLDLSERDNGPFKGLDCTNHAMLSSVKESQFLLSRNGAIRTQAKAERVVSGLAPAWCFNTSSAIHEATHRIFAVSTVAPLLSKLQPRAINVALTLGLAYQFAAGTKCYELLGNPQHLQYSNAAFGTYHPAITLLLDHCDDVPDAVLLALASATHDYSTGAAFECDETSDAGNTYCQMVFGHAFEQVQNRIHSDPLAEVDPILREQWRCDLALSVDAQSRLINAAAAHFGATVHVNGASRAVLELLRVYVRNTCAVDAAARRCEALAGARASSWRGWHHGAMWLERHQSIETSIRHLCVVLMGLNILSKGVPVGLHVNRSVEGVPEVQYVLMGLQVIPAKGDATMKVRIRLSSSSVNAYWVGFDSRALANHYRNSVVGDQLVSIPALPKYDRLWVWVYETGPHSCMTGRDYEDSPVRAYCAEGSELYLHVKLQVAEALTADALLDMITHDQPMAAELEQAVMGRAIGGEKSYVRAYGQLMDSFMRNRGFEHDDAVLEGQPMRFLRHPTRTGYILMPYLDGCSYNVSIDGEDITIDDSGRWDAQESDGYIYVGSSCRCAKCGDRVPEDDTHSTDTDGEVCDDCFEDYKMAEDVNGWVHEDEVVWSDEHSAYIVTDADSTYCTEGIGYWSTELVSSDNCDYTGELVPDQYLEEDDDGNQHISHSMAVSMGVETEWYNGQERLCNPPDDEEEAA